MEHPPQVLGMAELLVVSARHLSVLNLYSDRLYKHRVLQTQKPELKGPKTTTSQPKKR